MQYTHFGYEFLQKNSNGQYHPGWDLNWGNSKDADLGLPVYPMTDGEVVYAKATGNAWGNLMVVHHPHINMWTRYGHLQKMNYKVGNKVKEKDILATCGKSGTSSAHVHWDLIIKKLPNWEKYTTGMSRDEVREWYQDGIEFVNEYEDEKEYDPIVKTYMDYNSNSWVLADNLYKLGKITEEEMHETHSYLSRANDVFRS